MDNWTPKSLLSEFANEKNEFINCLSSNVISIPLKKFWDGFEFSSKRLRDERGVPMLLKLNNWPTTEDFSEILPKHVSDLLEIFPIPEYTSKSGKFNLASRIPDSFVKPDLGPKLYIAYGSSVNSSKGTTNLHFEVPDTVNVLIHVGIPKDGDYDTHRIDALKIIDNSGCDMLTRRRVRDNGELPGALWHVYHASDADKIRDFLNKIAIEKDGVQLAEDFDPIREQTYYLDVTLRERLLKEYGVEAYAIAQCQGDAIFIPSGCPYQVKNLQNCIKAAEDFISAENLAQSLFLTNENSSCIGSSSTTTNSGGSSNEDKFQVKNIIYHTIKDCVSILLKKQVRSSSSLKNPNFNDSDHELTKNSDS